MTGGCWPSEHETSSSNDSPVLRRSRRQWPLLTKVRWLLPERQTRSPERLMQPRSRPDHRLSKSSDRARGYAGRRPAPGNPAILDAGAPHRREAGGKILTDHAAKRYDSIAVVV